MPPLLNGACKLVYEATRGFADQPRDLSLGLYGVSRTFFQKPAKHLLMSRSICFCASNDRKQVKVKVFIDLGLRVLMKGDNPFSDLVDLTGAQKVILHCNEVFQLASVRQALHDALPGCIAYLTYCYIIE